MLYPLDPTEVDPKQFDVPGLAAHDLTAAGGTRLVVWAADPAPGRPVIVYFHGNAANLANRINVFRYFIDNGFGLAALGYRGSSGSGGRPRQDMIEADAMTFYRALPELVDMSNDNPIVLYGESMGTGVSVQLANALRDTGLKQPDAMVLEAPYTSIPDVTASLYPWLSPLTPVMVNQWQTLETIPQIDVPLLVVHGTDDTLIPIEMGRAVYAAAGTDEKQLIEVPDAGHNETLNRETARQLLDYLNQVR
nr:alpha/beta hydrolase [Pseudaestuariivita rosea]